MTIPGDEPGDWDEPGAVDFVTALRDMQDHPKQQYTYSGLHYRYNGRIEVWLQGRWDYSAFNTAEAPHSLWKCWHREPSDVEAPG